MQRCSSSIASLAAALAKAQGELVNPEKSLVATIPADRPGGSEKSFRYASLASGLDIVRKTLGQHEIATVQTTAVDQGAGIVNLTTVLAHSSGEWIASDWPVCPISATATPRRMGEALTYARRYALFTLVGIAGEDDLDAPDLNAPTGSASDAGKAPLAQNKNGHLNGGQTHALQQSKGAGPGRPPHPAQPVLGADESAALRERMLGEINVIGSGDDAALWAYCNLRAKDGLTTADAGRIEEAFAARVVELAKTGAGPAATDLESSETAAQAPHSSSDRRSRKSSSVRTPGRRITRGPGIDKSRLAHPEPRRLRDRDHVRFVAKQPCLICGRIPSDPHHLRFAQSRALGRKVSDEFTVPLCRGHHREVHRCGDEAAWWCKARVDPTGAARALWLETHPLPAAQQKIGIEGVSSGAVIGTDESNAKDDRPVRKRGPNYKTKPINAAGPL